MSNILHEYRVWPANGTTWRETRRVKPDQPWVPSPGPELVRLPLASGSELGYVGTTRSTSTTYSPRAINANGTPSSTAYTSDRESESAGRVEILNRKVSKLSLRYWKDRWSAHKTKRKSRDIPFEVNDEVYLNGGRWQATPAAFKAYGYWARPVIYVDETEPEDSGGVTVDNAYRGPQAGPSNPTHEQIMKIMRSLQDTDGTQHPERWISRVEHPSLPPRPSLWPTPPSSPRISSLTPSQIQLNPFLEHRITGKSPLKFDIREGSQDNVELGDDPPAIQDETRRTPKFYLMSPRCPNGGQPATYPGVTEIRITALAENQLARFPWPFTVRARDGLPVTVQDVLFSIMVNFEQYMFGHELMALEQRQRDRIKVAYETRLSEKAHVPDGVRRVDFLGDRVMFRGLEPAPSGDGWMMFVGPQ
ncbi:hypothetical protein BXZ70DRAFT_1012225 [Cristinia sonorae]|uniref:DUF6699 domain-containing protein n=1 Tax=Cristinia sonorae TaxID=1940300 RepID=A0A8K0UH61_9AGAR|nr:hypothetical protein BXZ70DRAFT_1012225 [Cristinia sonorae]